MQCLLVRTLALVLLVCTTACGADSAPRSTARILAAHPHDPGAFTQGLLVHDGALFESTGQYGASRLRRVDIETGTVLAETGLDARYFGEGLAAVGDTLYWLTWKSGRAFLFDADTLEPRGERVYDGQGWGLTFDGEHLIMSDGSATLRRLDPDDFTTVDRITVRDGGRRVDDLNELEYIDGTIWANIWFSDRIVAIDAVSGHVRHVIEADNLREALPAHGHAEAFNGIAYDSARQRLLVTGKYWPRLFEIEKPSLDPLARTN